MREKILLIHPGYAKTGTTTLQAQFKYLDINVLGKPAENQSKTIWFKFFKEKFFFNKYRLKTKVENYEKTKNKFKDYLKIYFNNNKKVSIYSDEGMLGPLGNHLNISNLLSLKEIIAEIQNELNIKIKVKFILSIRQQYDLILSMYLYSTQFSESMSGRDFFKKIIVSEDYKKMFDFTFLVKKINKIFNSQILILPLELLINDETKYVDKFCKFAEIKNNIHNKLIHLNQNYILTDGKKKYYKKMQNHFSPIYYSGILIHFYLKKLKIYQKNFRNNTFLKKIYKHIKPKNKRVEVEENFDFYKNEIKLLYKNSNMELEKLCNVNLKELKYY